MRQENQELMRSTGTVVWLNLPLASLRRRLRDIIDKRPLVQDPMDLERLYNQREATYRSVAHREVDAEGKAKAIARSVLESVR
jgi:shikimate kinase